MHGSWQSYHTMQLHRAQVRAVLLQAALILPPYGHSDAEQPSSLLEGCFVLPGTAMGSLVTHVSPFKVALASFPE